MSSHPSASSSSHAVLMIHGLCSAPSELRYVSQRLRASGFAVYTPHIPGYGYSADGTQAIRPWRDWTRSLEIEFQRLAAVYPKVSVGGLCIGADLALYLGSRLGNRIASLVLYSTTLFYDGWALPWYRHLSGLAVIPQVRKRWSLPEKEPYGLKNSQIRRWVEQQMKEERNSVAGAASLPLEAIYQAQRLIREVKAHLASVTSPALIVHAREDDVSSVRSVHYLQRHLGSAFIQQMLLADSYHMITLDNERDRVASVTEEFLKASANAVRRHRGGKLNAL